MNQHGWFHQSSHDKKPLSSVARCRRLRLIIPLNPEDTTDWLRFWRQKLLKPELYPRSPSQLLFNTVRTYRLRHVDNYKAYRLKANLADYVLRCKKRVYIIYISIYTYIFLGNFQPHIESTFSTFQFQAIFFAFLLSWLPSQTSMASMLFCFVVSRWDTYSLWKKWWIRAVF